MREYGTLARISKPEDAPSVFAKLKDAGFSCCQLVYKPQTYCLEDAAIIRAAAQDQGIKIVSFFAGYHDTFTKWDLYHDFKIAGINSRKHGRKRIKYIKSAAAFAKSLGVEDVLIHAGFIANNPFSGDYKHMKKCLKNFACYCKQIGINVILETGGESPVTLLRIIEDIHLDNIYANLDTANLIMYGFGNPVDAVYTLNKHIKSLHLKDGVPPTSPNILGKETPIGEGFVDFKRVFAQLDQAGFDGPIIFEREIKGDQQWQDLKRAIQYLNTEIFSSPRPNIT